MADSQKNSQIPNFVHLHVHSEFSMLDGLNRIPKLVEKVKNSGMNSVALTDHGVLYGTYEFVEACNKNEIKPIIGVEMYISPKERTIREEINGIKYYHLVLLAKNLEGYHNLVKLISIGHLEGMYYKPRVDREILEKYSKGIICTSACSASPLGKHFERGELDKAKDWLEFLHNTFKNDFYLELQRHGLLPNDELPDNAEGIYNDEQYEFLKFQSRLNKQLIEWSKEYNISLIASTDAHYLDAEDEFTQEVVFAIKDGKTLDDPTRRLPYKHTYIKTPEEMFEAFSDIPEVLENTQKLADTVEEYSIVYDRNETQPRYPYLPKGVTPKEELRRQAYEGAKKRYGKITDEIKERLDYELDLIDKKGYSDYFLVTSDYVKWARQNGIVVSMRGSGTSSVVAYSIEITNIDPIWWGLMFARFLNPNRPSPPDFDLDLADSERDRVFEYVRSKYGEDNFVFICTFGRLMTKAAIRDVCRVMGIDLQIADNLSKMVPVKFGTAYSIEETMEAVPEFKSIIQSDSKLHEMVKIVEKISGMKRHLSKHPCATLITPKPVTDFVPVQLEPGGGTDSVMTQFEGGWIEAAGLMKFDFLGLANLTIIGKTLEAINKGKPKEEWLTIDNIPVDDEETLELFRRGDTTSVFQFESAGMKRFLRELQPESIRDLCFLNAAYRPGPMELIPEAIKVKHGEKEAEYLVPELKPILEETYGVIIYQEQIMRIAVEISNYKSMGDADNLRRAVAKKKKDKMAYEEPRFKQGMIEKGYTKEQADALWNYLLPFANYGFPKAHSAMYSVVAFWTAYLKVHYPLQFMSARLTADMNKPDKLVVALKETKEMGIEILSPDINKSKASFEPEGDMQIRYGLNGIKNVGHNVVEDIIKEREEGGDFKNLDDLCLRVSSINSRTLEALIKVGALSDFGERAQLLAVYQQALNNASKEAKMRDSGQLGMFGSSNDSSGIPTVSTTLPNVEPITTAEKLNWEKELLGIYFTAHPLQEAIDKLKEKGIKPISEAGCNDGKNIIATAIITDTKRITTKKGDPMAFLYLDDMSHTYDGVLFPKTYKDYFDKIEIGKPIVFLGKCNERNERLSIIINKFESVEKILDGSVKLKINGRTEKIENTVKNSTNKKVATLFLNENADSNDLVQLKDILLENPGNYAIKISLFREGKQRTFKLKRTVSKEILTGVISKLSIVDNIEFSD